MITHTSDSHQIQSQDKTKSKLQVLKNCQKSNKMYKYEMDPTRTVGATEPTWDAGQTEGQTEGQTDGRSETNIPPQQLHCARGIITSKLMLYAYALKRTEIIMVSNATADWLIGDV